MCGRGTLSTPEKELRELLKLTETPLLNPRYNIAPSQDLPVIREPYQVELIHWGLSNVGRARGINVRAETVARAPQYRDAFRARRCLVIVDGFFEWKRAGKVKQPFLIHRTDRNPFALAGIWDAGPDGQATCAVITGDAQGVVAELHHRMPIVIPEAAYDRWLDPQEHNPLDLLKPYSSELAARPVSPVVNNPRDDDMRCIESVEGGDER